MPLKQDLGELLPPAAKDLAQHPAASCCMSAVWDGKTHCIFFRFYFECLDSAEQQGQAAGNRQAEPNCCGDWLLASVQTEERSSKTSPVKSKVSPHLSHHNPEKQRGQCSAIFLLNFLFSLRCFPLIFLECLTRYMLLEGTERKSEFGFLLSIPVWTARVEAGLETLTAEELEFGSLVLVPFCALQEHPAVPRHQAGGQRVTLTAVWLPHIHSPIPYCPHCLHILPGQL